MTLDSFNLEHWWKAVAAAGVALSVGAVAAKHNQLLVIGLGVFACGIGEWINRPIKQTLVPQGLITGYPWSPRPLGLTLDALGVIMIGYGILRLLLAA